MQVYENNIASNLMVADFIPKVNLLNIEGYDLNL
jgi:hypothetical protein